MKCFVCSGEGQVITKEWDQEWDRYDRNSPSHYDTNRHMDRSGIKKFEICSVCKGNKELEQLEATDITRKKVVDNSVVATGLKAYDYVLLQFDDNSFAKILLKDIEYGKTK